jgi:hypothetical protein
LQSVDALFAPIGRNGPVNRDIGFRISINSFRFDGRVIVGPAWVLNWYLPDRRKLVALVGML